MDLYDSQTGQLTLVRGSNVIGDGRQSVADDGAVLTDQGIARMGQIQPITWSQPPVAARLSPDGDGIAYDAVVQSACYGDLAFGYCDFYNILYARDLKTAAQVQLAQSPVYQANYFAQLQNPRAWFFPLLSNDGRAVLFRAQPQPSSHQQAIISNIDGTSSRVLTAEELGITEAVLSGDGHHTYAATASGGLIGIDIDSGDVQRRLPSSPLIFQSPSAVVPGSPVTFSGQFLATAAGQNRVSLAGYSAPVLASSPKSVTLQVPWEFDLNSSATFIAADPDSPFEQATPIESAAAAPMFVGVPHQDFRGTPTSADPARPGEILAFYMTGLGPVSPAVTTGQPAPLNALSYTQLPLACQWNAFEGGPPAEVLFAGLAPGLFGLYQVNVRVAASFTVFGQLTCNSTLPLGGRSKTALIVVPVAAP